MTNATPFSPGNCAVVTGGASGIGLAAAKRFAAMGLNVVIADLPGATLDNAAREVAAASPNGAKGVLAAPTDVSQLAEVEALEKAATSAFGPVAVLMNNAGIGPGSSILGDWDGVAAVVDVNLWGVIHGEQDVRAGHDRQRAAGDDRQHRLEAGHHDAAGRPRLQPVESRREGVHRSAAARAAQHRGRQGDAPTC